MPTFPFLIGCSCSRFVLFDADILTIVELGKTKIDLDPYITFPVFSFLTGVDLRKLGVI